MWYTISTYKRSAERCCKHPRRVNPFREDRMSILPQSPCVYVITCLVNDKVYIGSSAEPSKRWSTHRSLLRKNKHHSVHLQNAWNAYGENAFTFSIIENAPLAVLIEREQYWIDFHQSYNPVHGYNRSHKAGAPMAGLSHSEDTKATFSQQRMGMLNGNYRGPNCNCVVCGAPFRKAKRERKYCSQSCYHADSDRLTPELRYKFGIATRGKKLSLERVQKTVVAQQRCYIVTDPSGNEYHIKGLAAFCREQCLDQASMSHTMSGKQATHKGWKCRPATERS
jgi:group I intron endonuclease